MGGSDLRTGSSHTVCHMPELAVYQIPSGFRRCLPTAMLAESASMTLHAQGCCVVVKAGLAESDSMTWYAQKQRYFPMAMLTQCCTHDVTRSSLLLLGHCKAC